MHLQSGSKLRALHTLSRGSRAKDFAKRMECVQLAGALERSAGCECLSRLIPNVHLQKREQAPRTPYAIARFEGQGLREAHGVDPACWRFWTDSRAPFPNEIPE